MNRKFRLTKSKDFERVRRYGTSYAHPFIVLIKHPNELPFPRIAVAAGRSLGNAVQRNRAKRRIREAVRPLIPSISPGWDIIFLARSPMQTAAFQSIQAAVQETLLRAGLLNHNDD